MKTWNPGHAPERSDSFECLTETIIKVSCCNRSYTTPAHTLLGAKTNITKCHKNKIALKDVQGQRTKAFPTSVTTQALFYPLATRVHTSIDPHIQNPVLIWLDERRRECLAETFIHCRGARDAAGCEANFCPIKLAAMTITRPTFMYSWNEPS